MTKDFSATRLSSSTPNSEEFLTCPESLQEDSLDLEYIESLKENTEDFAKFREKGRALNSLYKCLKEVSAS